MMLFTDVCMQKTKLCVWLEGAHQVKVVLKCSTVDSGVVCAVPHLLLQLMRPLPFAGTWGTTVW